ncbi:hypothetical protein PPL_09440 [Heterostelium album PN500]|uniref:LRAT domain-containing protein n=1 Tax=Heterostelium pallidum (strain ATCC 26659 / Pp 5 / PN500) TaxID=670386 RepID=D3BPH2_HETP5|nr:hypothetical protein PPL_09440 [Heterostelium album PN500]EFA76690.1 hypothetical protein PPL_09440 [Heterostelium album PN500]|eukprot:XP_020428822.1 hypothetical protein PPL_09440 [Heterostelium album PN500]
MGAEILWAKDDDEFIGDANRQLVVVESTENNRDAFNRLVEIVANAANQTYHLLKYNCEHLVNYIMKGIASSKQVVDAAQKLSLGAMVVATGIAAYKIYTSRSESSTTTTTITNGQSTTTTLTSTATTTFSNQDKSKPNHKMYKLCK